MFPISCVRKLANCNFILCDLQTQEDFAHHITWNSFRIKRKACWENTTDRVTPGNKFVLEGYCLCFHRYVCCRQNASNRCFFVGPLITFQWKDFSQTCSNPRNSYSKELLIDALKRPCTKKWRGNDPRGTQAYLRDFQDKRGRVKEQLTFSGENLYPKIADSVNPIRKKCQITIFRSKSRTGKYVASDSYRCAIPSKTSQPRMRIRETRWGQRALKCVI